MNYLNMLEDEPLDEEERPPQKSNQRLIIILLLILLIVLIAFFAMRGCGALQPEAAATPSVELPPAPSNLGASAVLLYDVPVTWQDNSQNEDGFRVYWEGSDHPGQKIEAGSAAVNQTEFLDLGTACGVTYQYTVASYNTAVDRPVLPVRGTWPETALRGGCYDAQKCGGGNSGGGYNGGIPAGAAATATATRMSPIPA